MDNVYLRLDHARSESPVYRNDNPVVVGADRFGRFTYFELGAQAELDFVVADILGRTEEDLGWAGAGRISILRGRRLSMAGLCEKSFAALMLAANSLHG